MSDIKQACLKCAAELGEVRAENTRLSELLDEAVKFELAQTSSPILKGLLAHDKVMRAERDAAVAALAKIRAERECGLCGALVKDHGIDFSDGMIVGEILCPRPQHKAALATARALAMEFIAQKIALDWIDTFDRATIVDRIRAEAKKP